MELETFPTAKHMSISHAAARFEVRDGHAWDGLNKFKSIILGDVKQRLMWPVYQTATEQNRRPMCKSVDAKIGYPQATFPWFDSRADKGIPTTDHPLTLDCASCLFAKNPKQARADELPTCDSNYQLMLLDEDGKIVILRLSGAAKNEMSHYREWFKKNNNALFMFEHELELTPVKNNGRRYANLSIKRGKQTDRSKWVSEYLPLYRQWTAELQIQPSAPAKSTKQELPELSM